MKLSKILSNLIIFVLGIIAVIAIYVSIQLNIQNREYINIFGYSIFSTETASMSPTIEIGDIVIVKIGQEVQKGDIITYKSKNVFITHRIIEIEDESIIAKGDNNNTEDEPISKDNIIGKVRFVINNVGIWKKVFSDITVIIPIFITAILIIILISYKEKTGEKND